MLKEANYEEDSIQTAGFGYGSISCTEWMRWSTGSSNGTTENGDATSASSENEVKDLIIPRVASRELETFNILYSQRLEDTENLTNLVDGLLESDTKGELVPCIAEEWGTEDGGLTWTFKLREGVKWVDMNGQEKADCNAQDFATGLECGYELLQK